MAGYAPVYGIRSKQPTKFMTLQDFIDKLPERFRPEVVEGMSTCFQFDLSGDGGGQYTIELIDGQLQIHEGLVGEPKCVIRADAADFLAVLRGEHSPIMAVLTGKIKISNQAELLKYAKIFGLM